MKDATGSVRDEKVIRNDRLCLVGSVSRIVRFVAGGRREGGDGGGPDVRRGVMSSSVGGEGFLTAVACRRAGAAPVLVAAVGASDHGEADVSDALARAGVEHVLCSVGARHTDTDAFFEEPGESPGNTSPAVRVVRCRDASEAFDPRLLRRVDPEVFTGTSVVAVSDGLPEETVREALVRAEAASAYRVLLADAGGAGAALTGAVVALADCVVVRGDEGDDRSAPSVVPGAAREAVVVYPAPGGEWPAGVYRTGGGFTAFLGTGSLGTGSLGTGLLGGGAFTGPGTPPDATRAAYPDDKANDLAAGFVAGFLAGLARFGRDPEAAVRFGISCAAASVFDPDRRAGFSSDGALRIAR